MDKAFSPYYRKGTIGLMLIFRFWKIYFLAKTLLPFVKETHCLQCYLGALHLCEVSGLFLFLNSHV